VVRTQLYINGEWRDSENGAEFTVWNPTSGSELASVASGTSGDATAAVDAAAHAQTGWAAEPPRVRSEILRQCWENLLDHIDDLADLIVSEHGKPRVDAAGEVAYAAEFFRWNAEETVRIHGTIGASPSGGNKMIVHHPPVGVVVMVTPWNFPAAMITRKVAPALGAGNGLVIKPPKYAPLTALRVAELLSEAGVPDGLVNVVPSQNASTVFDAAIAHKATRMVSFTGSTEVGKILLRGCADRVLKVAMELGGNAPFVVFGDADLDAAVEGAMIAKMRHSAETCTAANRFLVESSVVDAFTSKLAEAMSAVKVGSGFDPEVTCGPMIDESAVESIDRLVSAAVDGGAEAVIGGSPIEGPGYFYEPTVLTGVNANADIVHHEIFGPVAPIIPFDDLDAMVEQANDTEMGLTGYVYTSDLAKGLAVSERIQAGMIGLNRGAVSDPAAPFGGMKQSGLGREGAQEGILEFCETQYIATDW